MRDIERRKLEKFERQQAFMTANVADFPPSSPGEKSAAINKDAIDEINARAAEIEGDSIDDAAYEADNRSESMSDLVRLIRNINRAANAFEDVEPGIDMQFRLPRNRSQKSILATARTFYENARSIEEKFVEYGLGAAFLAELRELTEAVDAPAPTGVADSGAAANSAVGKLLDAVRRGMANSRRLDAIVRIKYQNDPHKLADWTIASHLERDAQS